MELEFYARRFDEMKIVNVKPQHDTFGIKDAKMIAPGHPGRSVMLHRDQSARARGTCRRWRARRR